MCYCDYNDRTFMNKYLDAYYRVSTKIQKTEGHSLESQRRTAEKLAERLGLIIRPHDEGSKSSTLKNASGRNIRDELDEIKTGIEDGEVRNIWIVETSRLFRTRLDHITFESLYLEKYGCQMWVGDSSESWKFGKKEEVNLLYAFQQIMDEQESRKIRRRSIRGKRHLLESYSESVPIFLGGTPTFGYKNVDKRWVENKEDSKWVKWMFKEYSKGMQSIEIKNYLDTQGVKPRRTNTGLWNIGTIQKMLGNESYTGLKRWFDKDNEKEYIYQIPQIITESLYQKVKTKLSENHKVADNNKKHFSILDGFLYCSCGLRMSSTSKKRTWGTTETYFCVSKQRKWRGEELEDCTNDKSLNRKPTDNEVIRLVKDIVKNSHTLKDQFKNDVLSKKFESDKEIKSLIKSLEDKIRRNQKSLENTIQNIVKQEIERIQQRVDENIVNLIIKGLNDEKEHYEREREKFIQEIKDLDERKQWLDWISQYGDFLRQKTSTEKKTKEWLSGLINKIIVTPVFGMDRDGNKNVQKGNTFTIIFKMKIVDDKFQYNDPNNKNLGYKISVGKQQKKSIVLDFTTGRGKNKKKSLIKEVSSKVHSESFHNSGVSLKYYNSECRTLNSFGYGGIILTDEITSQKYNNYLCFSVKVRTNRFVY